ncbi:MAG TPA: molybdopterin cofactor-binding domain-containing protein [Thermoanaerobaculia bacterium]|nr:molybdopterin cofactor-binding domain-containing protein [Thermoanaerobaculia bacterium]
MRAGEPSHEVSFFVNGKPVTIENPSPDLLLIDYLRSPEVALAGPKKPCGQGGCGGCTVILSRWDEEKNAPEHRAINSCLRPVCALGGLVVTTVEGTGAARRPNPEFLLHSTTASRGAAPIDAPPPPVYLAAAKAASKKREAVLKAVQKARAGDSAAMVKLVAAGAEPPSEHSHEGMNPVAHALALNNGSQCGYCSVGFVMNMSEFITNHPNATKKEIEDAFDGNLCRCTGYRAILTGMKTFASDWTEEDERNRMKCLEDEAGASQLPAYVEIPFPPEARGPLEPVSSRGSGQEWRTPETLAELAAILHANRGKKVRLVHGNTSYGIYKDEFPATQVFADIRLIPELNGGSDQKDGELWVSAGTTYADFLGLLEAEMEARKLGETSLLGALDFMARRTAGRIVRNAASLGGNTMLVLKHIASGTGEPFPSDLFTALVAAGAKITFLVLGSDGGFEPRTATAAELVEAVVKDAAFADKIVLTSYSLPLGGAKDVALAQKVALREVNAHSIVNATTRFKLTGKLIVKEATLVYGGIAPYPWRPRRTEAAMAGEPLALDRFGALAKLLEQEVRAELKRWEARMAEAPDEGFTTEYRTQLAVSFLYKAIVNARVGQGAPVPPAVKSSGEITWGHWPVSDGTQHYVTQAFKRPVGQPYIKSTAMYQTAGQLHYTQELAVPPLTVNGAFVQSRRALASYHFVIPGRRRPADASALRKHLSRHDPSFVDLITYENIKNGGINDQGMGLDQPLFAVDMVSYVGQSIAMVLATTEQEAIRIADYVTESCVEYSRLDEPPWNQPPWNEPILDIFDAIEANSIFPDAPQAAPYVSHVWRITRPGSQLDWVKEKNPLDRKIVHRKATVGSAKCAIVESSQLNGGQVHFYMETQACVAIPMDEGRINVKPSTQSPMEMHQTIAMALGVSYHQVQVEVAPVGGGFGGKTEQTRFVTGPAAVAAKATKRPVRVAVPRDEDTAMIGKRHAYYGQYQIAVDRGDARPQDKGIIHGFQLKMWGDGGAFYDCSFIVSNCIQLRTDNAYRVANFQSQIDVCRTNTAPSTAFRAFGDIQGKNVVENAIDDAAFVLDMPAEDLREKNFYDRGDATPFGQALSYCYMKQVWAYLKQVSRYEEKRAAVDEFNRRNRWRKRGLAMIPVKYGSGYNFVLLEQSAAVVVVNQADGTIVIHQSGVEMGQGLATQALQVASYVLNVPMSMIYIDNVKTSVTPNPTSTGASTGTPYAAEAVKRTCQDLRTRLLEFGYEMLDENGDDWCKKQGIDFWNYKEQGWAAKVTANGRTGLIWQFLIGMAFAQRVSLVAAFNAKIHGGEVQVPAMTFKPEALQPNLPGVERVKDAQLGGGVDSFVGFTYSAALSVVDVDVLTGEVKILSSDLVYDMGWSMNPAIDIGQVEGAFVQGIGYLTTEKLVFEPDGEEKGRLNTTNTWRYKIPAVTTIPLELNTYLFPRDLPSVASIPEDPNEVFSAKEVGEPPLVLANSVFFAIKAAIRASRLERGLDGLFHFDAPATVQEVRRACEVSTADLG